MHNVSSHSYQPISVLIAMKNEKENLPSLFNSLSNLDYPKDKFEIIIVDDNSTDGTFTAAKEIFSSLENVNIVKVTNKKYPYKKGALDFGLQFCKNDFIALTDADCKPEKDWLKKISVALEKFDLAFGSAPLIPTNTLASKFAAYESSKNQVANLIGLQIGIPFSATGRNFAYKKSSFLKIGGYSKTLETISGDDDLLLREAYIKKLKIGFIDPGNAKVFSNAPDNWEKYFKQRSRHVKTSHHYTFIQKLFGFIYFVSEIIFTYSFLLVPFGIFFPLVTLLKLKITYSTIKQNIFLFYTKPKIGEFLLFELIFPIILLVNFTLSIFSKTDWENKKGEHN